MGFSWFRSLLSPPSARVDRRRPPGSGYPGGLRLLCLLGSSRFNRKTEHDVVFPSLGLEDGLLFRVRPSRPILQWGAEDTVVHPVGPCCVGQRNVHTHLAGAHEDTTGAQPPASSSSGSTGTKRTYPATS